MLYHLCHAGHAMLCYAMLCCAVLSYTTLCYAVLCYETMCMAATVYGHRAVQQAQGRGTDIKIIVTKDCSCYCQGNSRLVTSQRIRGFVWLTAVGTAYLDIPGPQRPLQLHCTDGMNLVSLAQVIWTHLTQPYILDLALFHKGLYGYHNIMSA